MTSMLMYCDGLCEPTNPGGWACWAWVLLEDDRHLQQACGCLGDGPGSTNNRAEYEAVIRGLRFLQANHLDGVRVRTDSQLVVRQLQGVYAVRSPAILPLYAEAMSLVRAIAPVLEWIPREQNTLADALTRQAYAEARGQQHTPVGRPQDAALGALITRLDGMRQAVTDWEAGFLESILRQMARQRPLTEKQRAIVQRMARQYLTPTAVITPPAG